ncbi:hypothetical protein EJ05DRAFT_501087 [Pseudovirgaria hyperparasitica]|uniref:Cell wall protein PhiA n=1 Tax=Pseudovirgaria hyperparasitica TaxID=470096 RepID=A0A6A6W6M0_9PEZI|nr:uncharacterized protein EJ05DRAFT_501087 [Pseudovirgaria hyperparasitica]KAF2757556.1 hypothetical protein EJ05DRAFT_501087 [Pseudovirgaria hyperparasitica]
MQYSTLALAAFTSVAAALPAPQIETPCTNEPFGAVAIHSGSDAHLQSATAWKGNLLVGGQQDATCESPSAYATFVIQDDTTAYLYADTLTQQLYVDRSGMGQGKSGYTNEGQSLPRNGEVKGWSISEDGYLVFDGMSPKACPTEVIGGSFSLWFSNADEPGFNKNCTGVALRAVKADSPVSCIYSSS